MFIRIYKIGVSVRKVIDILTESEKEEILELYEKKQAMENLSKIISKENDPLLFQTLKSDYLELVADYTAWWNQQSEKKGWEKGHLFVDFHSNEVIMTE